MPAPGAHPGDPRPGGQETGRMPQKEHWLVRAYIPGPPMPLTVGDQAYPVARGRIRPLEDPYFCGTSRADLGLDRMAADTRAHARPAAARARKICPAASTHGWLRITAVAGRGCALGHPGDPDDTIVQNLPFCVERRRFSVVTSFFKRFHEFSFLQKLIPWPKKLISGSARVRRFDIYSVVKRGPNISTRRHVFVISQTPNSTPDKITTFQP